MEETIMRSNRTLAVLLASIAFVSFPALGQIQTPPTGSPQQETQPPPAQAISPSNRDPTQALSPTESFGSIYGTQNLANPPAGAVPERTPSPPTVFLRPEALEGAQNQRTQPPVDISAYTSYINSDALLNLLDQLRSQPNPDTTIPVLLAWNHVSLDMTSIDHTTAGQKVVVSGIPVPLPIFEPTYGEQFGPPRSSRAMAIVHLAMFEATNAIDSRFASYRPPGEAQDIRTSILAALGGGNPPNVQSASLPAAVTQAAHDTLISLYPHKSALIEASLLRISILVQAQESARGASDAASRIALGKAVGAAAAAIVNASRQNDGSNEISNPTNCNPIYPNQPTSTILPPPLCWEKYFPSSVPLPSDPLTWTIDPVSAGPLQLGALWKDVTPFVLGKHEFTPAQGITLSGILLPLPNGSDPAFKQSLNDGAYGPKIPDPHGSPVTISSKYGVRSYGGWGAPAGTPINFPPGQGPRALTPTQRTPDQTFVGNFWGYDATALLCAPPRLYNMIATSFYLQHGKVGGDLHAAVELARYLALTNIALADAGVAAWDAKYTYNVARPVTYIRDHTLDPMHPDDYTWTALGQVASNGAVTNTTPGFPAYPSGHAVFGAATFAIIGRILNLDKTKPESAFDFVSDEYNGHTFGADGKLRPFKKVHFISLQSAEWENAESRIYLGIHWQKDADDGIALGDAIADKIFNSTLRPIPGF
jgi:membrane-associated phospholipid phosphatase